MLLTARGVSNAGGAAKDVRVCVLGASIVAIDCQSRPETPMTLCMYVLSGEGLCQANAKLRFLSVLSFVLLFQHIRVYVKFSIIFTRMNG